MKMWFRWQRIRFMALSQPNLDSFDIDSDGMKCDESESSDSIIMRTNSNPNLIESECSTDDSEAYIENVRN